MCDSTPKVPMHSPATIIAKNDAVSHRYSSRFCQYLLGLPVSIDEPVESFPKSTGVISAGDFSCTVVAILTDCPVRGDARRRLMRAGDYDAR